MLFSRTSHMNAGSCFAASRTESLAEKDSNWLMVFFSNKIHESICILFSFSFPTKTQVIMGLENRMNLERKLMFRGVSC